MPTLEIIESFLAKRTRIIRRLHPKYLCPSTIAEMVKQFPYEKKRWAGRYNIYVTPLEDRSKGKFALITYDNKLNFNENKIADYALSKLGYTTVLIRSVAWLEDILKNN